MGFALWIEQDLLWAQGTHEYRPLGTAVVAASDLFSPRDFSPRRRAPLRRQSSFAGLFGSLEDVNAYLKIRRSQEKPRPSILSSKRVFSVI
jgi:hypothetical protein